MRFAFVLAVSSVAIAVVTACTSHDLEIEAPRESRIDEEIEIAVSGADPDEEVVLAAETRDRADNRWVSEAAYTADAEGVVHLGEEVPVSGSYDTADPMGLFWSMEPHEEAERIMRYSPPQTGMEVELSAETESGRQARAELLRHFGTDGVEREWIAEDGVVGGYFSPDTDEEVPGIVLLHGRPATPLGFKPMTLASRGYRVFAPLYFQPENAEQLGARLEGIGDLPEALVERPIEYVQDAIDWLQERPDVASVPVGVGGASAGGELALIAGEYLDGIGAIVSWHGPGLKQGAFPRDRRERQTSAWSFAEEPLPYVSDSRMNVLEATVEQEARGKESPEPGELWRVVEPLIDEEVRIRVENSNAPVLLISGFEDVYVKAAVFQEGVAQRLSEIDYEPPHEHRSYEDAGHWFNVPYVPQYTHVGLAAAGRARRPPGGSAEGDAAAAADSWPRVLEYFRMGAQGEY